MKNLRERIGQIYIHLLTLDSRQEMLNLVQNEQKRKTVKKNDTIIKMCPYCSMMA